MKRLPFESNAISPGELKLSATVLIFPDAASIRSIWPRELPTPEKEMNKFPAPSTARPAGTALLRIAPCAVSMVDIDEEIPIDEIERVFVLICTMAPVSG